MSYASPPCNVWKTADSIREIFFFCVKLHDIPNRYNQYLNFTDLRYRIAWFIARTYSLQVHAIAPVVWFRMLAICTVIAVL